MTKSLNSYTSSGSKVSGFDHAKRRNQNQDFEDSVAETPRIPEMPTLRETRVLTIKNDVVTKIFLKAFMDINR